MLFLCPLNILTDEKVRHHLVRYVLIFMSCLCAGEPSTQLHVASSPESVFLSSKLPVIRAASVNNLPRVSNDR
jgi:hypothetical protein